MPSREPPPNEPPRRRRRLPAEELALLTAALLLLIVPGALSRSGDEPRRTSWDAAPLTIEVESAAWYEWALLEGIGEARARRIVEWVRERAPLRSLDELVAVPGLPGGWLEKARPHLRLGAGETDGGPTP